MVSNMLRLYRRSEFRFLVSQSVISIVFWVSESRNVLILCAVSHANRAKVTDEASDTPAGTANDFRYNIALLQQSSATES
ncbi:hypothetical protein SLA2020_399780 [Shorea laevis]